MNNGYIAILDSGIGGFSFLIQAARRLNGERFLYFGDNSNAPYGNKSVKELYTLTQKNLDEILKHDVKAVVCACNTLSTSVLPRIVKRCDVPVFGVYPPVNACQGNAVLFATPITCARYVNIKGLSLCPLKNLAGEIERNKFNLKDIDISAYFQNCPVTCKETIILGCTHYFFVKKQFINHFCPQKVLIGEEYTAERLDKSLRRFDMLAKNQKLTVDFIGNCAEENYKFYS